jgi:cytochrome c
VAPALAVRRRWPWVAGAIIVVALVALAGIARLVGGSAAPTVGGGGPIPAPQGDVAAGEAVFTRGCMTCHTTTDDQLVGPGLAGLFAPGGPTLPQGVDYGGKLPNGQPITDEQVRAWIRSGGQGRIGFMPPNGNLPALTDEELTDLIAFLATLTK